MDYRVLIFGLLEGNNFESNLLIQNKKKRKTITEFLMFLASCNTNHYRNSLDTDWMNMYLEYDFFRLFRMNQHTFMHLLAKIDYPDLHKPYLGGGVPIPAYLQLSMTLWWLGKGETLLSVSERFGVAVSTVFQCTERILVRLLNLMDKYIFWPNAEEIVNVEREFRERCGFPGNANKF